MINMLNKKKVLSVSIVGILSLILIVILQVYFDLSFGSECGAYNPPIAGCLSALLTYVFVIFIPILIFSLITYRLKEDTFLSWQKFTVIYLFIYLFIIIIAPWQHDPFFPIEKEIMVMIFCSIYTLISLILITYKSFSLRKNV